MLSYLISALIPVLGLLVALTLLFWQASNIYSAVLGAPAVSSPRHRLWRALADKKKTLIDLGCGNGSACIAAAAHFKQVYGLEYSPFYYLVSRWRTRRLSNVTILFGNVLRTEWPKADLIYCYLMPPLLGRLRPRLKGSGATVLSFAFAIPGWQPKRVLVKDKQRLFIYF